MLKKTSAFGGLAIAATAAGLMLSSTPASAQVPMWHHGHRVVVANRNLNLNRNRVVVRVVVRNRNNNIAVANNRNNRFRRFRGFFDDGFLGDGCCRRRIDGFRRFDGFDGLDGIGRGRLFDDGATAIVGRRGGIFAHAG